VEAKKEETVTPYLEGMVKFLHRSAADESRSDEVLKAAVGLLGDLGKTFGAKMQPLYQMPFVPVLLTQAAESDQDIQEIAKWTKSVRLSVYLYDCPHMPHIDISTYRTAYVTRGITAYNVYNVQRTIHNYWLQCTAYNALHYRVHVYSASPLRYMTICLYDYNYMNLTISTTSTPPPLLLSPNRS
jgi:hypothetical protein